MIVERLKPKFSSLFSLMEREKPQSSGFRPRRDSLLSGSRWKRLSYYGYTNQKVVKFRAKPSQVSIALENNFRENGTEHAISDTNITRW